MSPTCGDQCEVDEVDFNRCFPWIKVIIKFLKSLNYTCSHALIPHDQVRTRRNLNESCCRDCYLRLFRNSHSLVEAVVRVYETSKNLILFEKYEKQLARARQSHAATNKDSLKKMHARKPAAVAAEDSAFHHQSLTKARKNSQSSSNSQKIFFINNFLKKSSNSFKSSPVNVNLFLANTDSKPSTKMINLTNDLNVRITKNAEKMPTVDYLYNQVHFLNQLPLLVLCKSVLVMTDDLFIDVIQITWNLLLNSDQEISSAAASLFLMGAMRQQNYVEELLRHEMNSKNPDSRFKACLKFEILWKFRYHVWPHLEINAHNLLKISPPCIEFVLPSPPVGVPFTQPVDPPWMPKAKTKVEEVTINQEEVRAVVTASKSRKKHQQEKIYKALEADQLNKKIARENFFFTNLGYLQYASFEPLLFQSREEPEEVINENEREETRNDPAQPPPNVNLNRRQSVAVTKRLQQRNSIIWNRKSFLVGEGGDENQESNANASDMQQSQPIFPTSISSAVLSLIDLLNDCELSSNNQSANRIIWTCLTEDAILFLRYFFEKITQKDKRNMIIQALRRLINAYSDFPPQTAHTIMNYLLGVVMYNMRSPGEGSQEAISAILTLIWRVVGSVNGIVFKDLKQTLRKEQCDPSLLITANLPSAKKLVVHGPDLSQIPSQFPIYDNTQFSMIIQDSFSFFKIPENKRDKYYLFDIKTNQIHVPDSYVRNFYFFRRNFYPQLSLVEMDPREATKLLERAAFNLKIHEQSKVLFFRKLLDSQPYNQMNTTAAFLHDELTKLPMFPRKALEADFNIFPRTLDRELLTTDMLHKYSWCQLIWSLFSSINSKTASTADITLFISVINGVFFLHCEDLITIRTCLAIYLNTAQHFQHIFATNGFMLILPTIMKIYSNMQSNNVLKSAIEFSCQQFFMMHRIPFILQLFGSVAQILDSVGEKTNQIDTSKIQSSALFGLLESMERNQPDSLRILELVRVNSDSSSPLPTTTAQIATSATSGAQSNVASAVIGSQAGSGAVVGGLSAGLAAASVPTGAITGVVGELGLGAAAAAAAAAVSPRGGAAGDTAQQQQAQPHSIGSFSGPPMTPHLTPALGQLSSPVNLLTTAGASSAVLAVSGIQATNLLITSSGALGINQIASLTAVAAANSGLTTLDPTTSGLDALTQPLVGSAGGGGQLVSPFNLAASGKSPNLLEQQQQLRSGIKALDFCYDDQNVRFSIVDAINLCVTVVAYATHTFRSNQMLIILDCLIPRYLASAKEETDRLIANYKHASPFADFSTSSAPSASSSRHGVSAGFLNPSTHHLHTELVHQARAEFALIQKTAVSIKTMVNTSDFLARTIYSAIKMDGSGGGGGASSTPKPNSAVPNAANRQNRSPSIMPDEDSMRFNEDKRGRQQNDLTGDDSYQYKHEFRSPRDTLLNIVSEFVFSSSKRIKELYKVINDPNLKVGQLLDAKAQIRLVEIANALLKLWEDPSILGGNGLQNYFQKLLPVTSWNEEELKPAFNNLLRRIDRVFTKISKRHFGKSVDWTAIAGLLNGLFLTLDKQDSIANLPYFKMLINSTISLVLNESTSDISVPGGLGGAGGGGSGSGSFVGGIGGAGGGSVSIAVNPQSPLTNTVPTGSGGGGGGGSNGNIQIPSPLRSMGGSQVFESAAPVNMVFSKAQIKLVGKYINCLKDQSNLELLFGASSTNPISPTVPSGMSYLINFLLPLLFWSASDRKDSPKLNQSDISFVVTILLNALKPPSKLAATLLLQAPKQHHLFSALDNPQASAWANKSNKQMKEILNQSTFLALKLVIFSFSKQVELTRVANTVRQLCLKAKSLYLWKFLDFITNNRTSLFLLLKPFIENFVEISSCENEIENQIRLSIRAKLNGAVYSNFRCSNIVLNELLDELNGIKVDLASDFKSETKSSPKELSEAITAAVTDEASAETAAAAGAPQLPPSSGSKEPSPHKTSTSTTATTTEIAPPSSTVAAASTNRNISFRISKIKKDTLATSGGGGGDETVLRGVESTTGSPTRTYRKKLDKLNYKVGASILEVYKERNKAKLQEASMTMVELIQKQEAAMKQAKVEASDKTEGSATKTGSNGSKYEKASSDINEADELGGSDLDVGDKQKLLKSENVNTITETSRSSSNKKDRSKLKKVVYI